MRRTIRVVLAMFVAGAATVLVAAPASAHVAPSTAIELDVHEHDVTANLTLPTNDLATASGIEIPAELDETTAGQLEAYLEEHFTVTSDAGAWDVSVADAADTRAEQWGTGTFDAVTAVATLTPPAGTSVRTFTLAYDAIIHQVVSADIFVTLHSDWSAGEVESARSLGVISLDTVTGTVAPLPLDLDDGSPWQGFVGMVTLGVSHIAGGTDHQLFLLTLLLPAPLLARGGRWRGVVPPRSAVRRITEITLAFTVGHSITLALGTLGLPVPSQAVEAAIAVSILVAAAHAIRPIFPGRESVVAGLFGLVHGMAFSVALAALDLSGGQLALSLLGFNLGIELMQLAVVLLVLPPLVVLARRRTYVGLRVAAALLTAVAATGWLIDRIGTPNPVGAAADALGAAAPWIVLALWIGGAAGLLVERAGPDRLRGRLVGRPTARALLLATRTDGPYC